MMRKNDYTLNYVLKNLVDDFINLKDEDRAVYEKNFDCVTDRFIKELCTDENFKSLFKSTCLSGSYADNLKIKKPDEFDLLLELELPMLNLVVIHPDKKLKSFCKIQITKILNELKKDPNNLKLLEFLKSIATELDSESYLDIFKFKEWFENLMRRIVENRLHYVIIDESSDMQFKVYYKSSGPAHTIGVQDRNRKNPENELDIDFVPAFTFGTKQWIAKRPWTDVVNKKWNENTIKWHALPKPINYLNGKEVDSKTFNTSFLTSYTPLEHSLIAAKPKIKIGIKLFKLLRDRGRHSTVFKSYFIKTLFLWKIEEEKNNMKFWDKNIDEIMILMIENLIDRINNSGLEFYWDDSFNMFVQKRKVDLARFKNDLEHSVKKLKEFPTIPIQSKPRIVEIFLNSDEKTESGLGKSNKVKKLKL